MMMIMIQAYHTEVTYVKSVDNLDIVAVLDEGVRCSTFDLDLYIVDCTLLYYFKTGLD